jgi:uncharacterized protein (TIGR02266 family)
MRSGMSQHNRKDPRAKVLSMTVRYRSATLNEFIEHHSYDVSRGGLFIKTPSPFAPGTLLKFEVKIAEDQRVMQGVGRVVWKRDASTGPEEPAGMGIKFIKLDESSKAVIERLVQSRGQHTVSAYDRSPDSRSFQMFPGADETTISDDPTVVRSRSDVFPAGIGVEGIAEASPVSPNLSIPVPSGPAVSVAGTAVSIPPLSTSPLSIPHETSRPISTPSPSRAPSGPLPRSIPPASIPGAASLAPLGDTPYRKPGPVPVNSAPPPRSSSAYVWLGLVALLVGGGFFYLKSTRKPAHGASVAAPAKPNPPVAPPATPSPEVKAEAAVPTEPPAPEAAANPSPTLAPTDPLTKPSEATAPAELAPDVAAVAPATALVPPAPVPKKPVAKATARKKSTEALAEPTSTASSDRASSAGEVDAPKVTPEPAAANAEPTPKAASEAAPAAEPKADEEPR